MNLGYKTTHTSSDNGCGCKNQGGNVCDTRKVKSISRVGSKAIIAFDDCTYIAAPFDVVDMPSVASGKGSDCSELEKSIAEKDKALEAKNAEIEKLKANVAKLKAEKNSADCDVLKRYLVPVHDMADTTIYYGIKPGMECPGLDSANAESVGGEDVPAVNPNGGGTTPTTPSKSNNDGTGDNPETTPDHDFNASAEPVLLGGDGSTNRPVIRGEEGRYYALDEADGKRYESDANGGFIEPRREM